jgi:hypothetical protein
MQMVTGSRRSHPQPGMMTRLPERPTFPESRRSSRAADGAPLSQRCMASRVLSCILLVRARLRPPGVGGLHVSARAMFTQQTSPCQLKDQLTKPPPISSDTVELPCRALLPLMRLARPSVMVSKPCRDSDPGVQTWPIRERLRGEP